MRYIVFMLLISCFSFSAFSQSKKKVKKHQIESREVWFTDNETGDAAYKKTEKTFNESGELIDEKKYDIRGQISEHRSFKFDDEGLLKEKFINNVKKKKQVTIIYKYNDDNKLVSESKYDKHKVLKSSIVFKYDDGKLIKEEYLNTKSKITKTIKYTYANKLKTSKTVLNANGKEIEKLEYKYKFQE